MKIVSGTRYTTSTSDLFMYVLAVFHEDDTYIKAKIKLTNKHNGIVYEIKTHKLNKKLISHWIKG